MGTIASENPRKIGKLQKDFNQAHIASLNISKHGMKTQDGYVRDVAR